MKKFLAVFHATPEAQEAMQNNDKEAMQQVMQAWFAWNEKVGDALKDMSPLASEQVITRNGVAPSQMHSITYAVIEAESSEAASELLKDHPHLNHDGCDIHLHEAMPMPGS